MLNPSGRGVLPQGFTPVAGVQHSWLLHPPEHIQMWWILGSLIGAAIGMAWIYIELERARRKPFV